MTYSNYLRHRLTIYDAIIAAWRLADQQQLSDDLNELESYRKIIYDRYITARQQRKHKNTGGRIRLGFSK